MKLKTNGNCLLIYGGGLCDPANLFMRTMADKLAKTQLFEKVFVGFYSFESMLNEDFIMEWNAALKNAAENALGGFFGTCRDVDLTDSQLASNAKKILKELNVKWIFVGGGDGSARQCAEIADDFEKDGIKIAFVMPCTIDGIEGSESIGMNQAVKTSCRIIEQLASTCLNTRSNFKSPGLIVELQGRNRDDILAMTLKSITEKKVKLPISAKVLAIPANYPWNRSQLVKFVNSRMMEQVPVLILMSEGANIKRNVLKKMFNRKIRTFEVAHLSQMNGMTDEHDVKQLTNILDRITVPMIKAINNNKSFSIVYRSNDADIRDIKYYSMLNPRDQKPTLSASLEEAIETYLNIAP